MTETTAIPEDIRELALAVVNRGYDEGLVDAVARALLAERLAERARCASIAESGAAFIEAPTYAEDEAGACIAAAIRRQEHST